MAVMGQDRLQSGRTLVSKMKPKIRLDIAERVAALLAARLQKARRLGFASEGAY